MNIRSLPTWLQTLIFFVVVGVVVQVAFSQGWLSDYWQIIIMASMIVAISAQGLNLKYGYAGLFALGQAAFYGIGAYASALVTKDWVVGWSGNPAGGLAGLFALEVGAILAIVAIRYLNIGHMRDWLREKLLRWLTPFEASVLSLVALLLSGGLVIIIVGGLSGWLTRQVLLAVVPATLGALPMEISQQIIFFLALIGGTVLAGAIGYLISLPILGLTYDYLCIATLGFAIMTYVFFNNADKLIPTMKGARGMVGIPPLTNWPWVLGCFAVSIVVLRNLMYSSSGRAILSARDDPTAAETMGIDVTKYKTLAYTIGCAYAGLAGGLFAHLYAFLHPSNFTWLKGVDPFVMVVFGGVGSMTGTTLGAYAFTVLLEGLRVLPAEFIDWRYVIYPLILLFVMLFRPQGIMGSNELGFLKQPEVKVNDDQEKSKPSGAES